MFVEAIIAREYSLRQAGIVGFVVWECKGNYPEVSLHEWYTVMETVYCDSVCSWR